MRATASNYNTNDYKGADNPKAGISSLPPTHDSHSNTEEPLPVMEFLTEDNILLRYNDTFDTWYSEDGEYYFCGRDGYPEDAEGNQLKGDFV